MKIPYQTNNHQFINMSSGPFNTGNTTLHTHILNSSKNNPFTMFNSNMNEINIEDTLLRTSTARFNQKKEITLGHMNWKQNQVHFHFERLDNAK